MSVSKNSRPQTSFLRNLYCIRMHLLDLLRCVYLGVLGIRFTTVGVHHFPFCCTRMLHKEAAKRGFAS